MDVTLLALPNHVVDVDPRRGRGTWPRLLPTGTRIPAHLARVRATGRQRPCVVSDALPPRQADTQHVAIEGQERAEGLAPDGLGQPAHDAERTSNVQARVRQAYRRLSRRTGLGYSVR